MTANQIIHHTEQLEAARRDFERLWDTILIQRFHTMKVFPNANYIAAMRDIAWQAFRAGQKGKP